MLKEQATRGVTVPKTTAAPELTRIRLPRQIRHSEMPRLSAWAHGIRCTVILSFYLS